MLLAPLRRKRDELAAEVKRTSDIPKHIIEECCQGHYYKAVGGFVMDRDCDEFKVPDCWERFITACRLVETNEKRELAAALAQ